MSLLTPLALLGLLSLPLIILLHILRTRREPLLISSLRLWEGLQQKKQGVLPRYIPCSLMLILQLCIAAALALGLARPVLSFLLTRPQHTIFVLDTTTSMMAEDAGQLANSRRFDVARQVIQTQLQEMGDDDTFVVLSLNLRPEILLTGDAQQKAQALLALDNLAPGATGLDLPTALTLANGLIQPDWQNEIIVLTDGNYLVDADTLPPMQIPVTWQFIPTQSHASNQALLSLSTQTWPDDRHRLFARVVNYGDAPVVRTLRLSANDRLIQEDSLELEPQTEVAKAWVLPDSAQTVTVEIVEPDVLPLDNRADLLLMGATNYRVLLISNVPEPESQALTRALEAQPGLELTIVDTATMSQYRPIDFDQVVFDGLPLTLTAWPDGNLLVVNPPLGHPLLPAENFIRDLRPDPTTASVLLTGIDLSGAYFDRASYLTLPDWAEADLMSFPLSDENVGAQVPLSRQANERHPLIFHGSLGNTRLVVWAFDLAESNLPGRLALPLLTANTLSTILSALPPSAVALGEPVLIDQRLSVEVPGGRRLFLPAQAEDDVAVFSQTKQAGLYKVFNENDRLVGGFAVHAGSTLESNLTAHFQPETLEDVDAATAITPPEEEHFEFWPWLAGLALIVVTVEGWLAWRK
jgi:Ca-activated chloride channel family protein